jgi:hypothetical protein
MGDLPATATIATTTRTGQLWTFIIFSNKKTPAFKARVAIFFNNRPSLEISHHARCDLKDCYNHDLKVEVISEDASRETAPLQTFCKPGSIN